MQSMLFHPVIYRSTSCQLFRRVPIGSEHLARLCILRPANALFDIQKQTCQTSNMRKKCRYALASPVLYWFNQVFPTLEPTIPTVPQYSQTPYLRYALIPQYGTPRWILGVRSVWYLSYDSRASFPRRVTTCSAVPLRSTRATRL